ncbi:MAG: MBL fold metallo-hydrolase [Gammaproteobacteria bacterium]
MKITFLGATRTVTGSKYLITLDSKKILVDCGLFQGYKEFRLRNWDKLPVDPREIDAVILTHAHIDHSGYLPLLIKNGFRGNIYSTRGTKDLCAILLPDSGYLQEEDANRANKYGYSKHKPAMPLYTMEDGMRALDHFVALDFDDPLLLFDTLSFKFLPAGHIIGSSLVYLEHHNTSVLFTGDLGRPNHPVMKSPAIVPGADYLIVESTYGDRLHDRSNQFDLLTEIIQQTVARGGSIIIPAFAVGRTQDLLYYLYVLKKEKRISDIPVFLDSPMAQDVSDLLSRYSGEHRLTKELANNICKIATYTKTSEESKLLDQYNEPIIIISASGMAEGGRILHHLKAFLPDKRNTILFTGYQGVGTRGERLLREESEIKIYNSMVPVRAEIKSINSMSAHADYQEMLGWLGNIERPPKKVFITHGQLEAATSLKNKIEEKFHWSCTIPEYLQTEILN